MVLTPFLTVYICVLLGVIGLVMGSFLNCAAIRLIHHEKIARGRSHCAVCGHTLSAADLVPLFSWLFLKGKCRYCGEKISPRYPIAELVSSAVYILTFLRFGLRWEFAEYLLLFSVLLCASFCDLEDCTIPDRFILAGIIIRIIFVFFLERQPWKTLGLSVLYGMTVAVPVLVITLVMEKYLGKEAMGGGDIKLFFMLGMYCSLGCNLLAVLLACLIGIICAVVSTSPEEKKTQAIPFGPAIALSWFITICFGQKIISWYLSLF